MAAKEQQLSYPHVDFLIWIAHWYRVSSNRTEKALDQRFVHAMTSKPVQHTDNWKLWANKWWLNEPLGKVMDEQSTHTHLIYGTIMNVWEPVHKHVLNISSIYSNFANYNGYQSIKCRFSNSRQGPVHFVVLDARLVFFSGNVGHRSLIACSLCRKSG